MLGIRFCIPLYAWVAEVIGCSRCFVVSSVCPIRGASYTLHLVSLCKIHLSPFIIMSSTFFTSDDGDVVLRAGLEPNSRHDFRVHKFILSLASSVFKDMFTLPQPPNWNLNEQHQLPVVDLPDLPEVLDAILRLVYPGVEPPKIPSLQILNAVLSTADKYNITSIYPICRDVLKTFVRGQPFGAYVVACRFGLSEEAREAAEVGGPESILSGNPEEELEIGRVSSIDILRWVRFVQGRQTDGLSIIQDQFDWQEMAFTAPCGHGEIGKDFYSRLEKAVQEVFLKDPLVGTAGLFQVLHTIPDPPPGCGLPPDSESGQFYYDADADEAFECPLRPMTIRNYLAAVAGNLGSLNRRKLQEVFGNGSG